MSKQPTRTAQLLAYCQTPRTMAQILVEFGGAVQWRYAVHNLVKRGDLINQRAQAHARVARPGLFVAAKAPAQPLQIEPAQPTLDVRFADLGRAWFGGGVRC
jgi:endonuclease YncB( thermonuclease family)